MGDFGIDTAVEGGDGRYTARLSPDWEIWGPCGGYVLAVALRAAGEHSRFERPANIACHFLGVAEFGLVEVTTTTLREGKRAESVRVSMTQGGRPICEAMAWVVSNEATGFEHDWTTPPSVPGPQEVPPIEERMGDDWKPWYPFWSNVEYRPLAWMPEEEWMARAELLPPVWQCWLRYRPTATFDDPFLDAGRVALLFDVMGWPALGPAIPLDQAGTWMAPNTDVTVWFHEPSRGADYLLLDATAPIAKSGLVGAWGQVWSEDGRLLASGGEHLLCRDIAPPRPE